MSERERPERTSDDPHRPAYHVTPPRNWMNDPNGLVEFDGRYHLFYQHNPEAPEWGDISWGHAASDDLARWTDLPLALEPEAGLDGDGCFSGCAVVDDGTPTLLYTAVESGRQRQALATSDDRDLRTWAKEGVVVADPPEGVPPDEFRDPYAYRRDGAWEMLVGATDGDPVVLRYRSPDLREWTYEGVCHREPDREGVWECPALVRFDAGDLLVGSVNDRRTVEYRTGDLASGFPTDGPDAGRLDYGDLYAPQAFRDETGRPLCFGWVTEARPTDRQLEAGWSGAMSVPRVLALGDDALWQAPAPELAALRSGHVHRDLAVEGTSRLDRAGRALELVAEFDGDAEEVGVVVRRSPDGEERTEVAVDREAGELAVRRGESSLDGAVADDTHRGTVPVEGPTTLHVFVDHSVVEAFANGRAAAASRVYPTRDDADGVALFARGGAADVGVDVWDVASAWGRG